MTVFAVLLDGLVSGAALATLALAFSAVYLPTKIFHVALGAIFAASPFVYAALTGAGLPAVLAAPLTVSAATVASALVERWNHAPLERRGSAETTHFVTSLGLFIVLVQLTVVFRDDAGHFLRTGVDELWRVPLFGVQMARSRVLLGVASTGMVLSFFVLLLRTRMGLRFRALAQNPTESALRGIDVSRVRLQAFAVSGLLGGLAAVLYAYDRGYDAYLGFDMVLLAVVAVIIGGRDSFAGPILGAVVLGIVRETIRWTLSARWQDAGSFFLLAMFLVMRPQGLIGRSTRVEEELS